jgi:hypothetical protein
MEKIKRNELIGNFAAEFATFSLEMLSLAGEAMSEMDKKDQMLFLADLSCFTSDMLFAFKSHVDFKGFSVPIMIDLLKTPRSGVATFRVFSDLRKDYAAILESIQENKEDFLPCDLIQKSFLKGGEDITSPIVQIIKLATKRGTSVEEENEQH